ncbi:hypothetical protein K438DRAFT_1768567 [Mycena galopus ATCC 62051]|nr:hypothetical protein K438DRAFT_1768567 [Mycena galopus ATCC 62051]
MELWLQRARNLPLVVALHSYWTPRTNEMVTALGRFSTQLKQLEIKAQYLSYVSLLHQGELPCLEKLDIAEEMDSSGHDGFFSLAEIMTLLHLAPKLVELTLHVNCVEEDTTDMITLPSLRFLALGGERIRRSIIADDDTILKHLSLPTLETLFLPFSDTSPADFPSFLQRSSSPLRTLFLGGGCIDLDFSTLAEGLRLVPSLTRLELFANIDIMDNLFVALADVSSSFLPNLDTLKIEHDCLIFEPFYQRVLRALLVRRAQLLCAHLRNPDEHQLKLKPSLEVGAGLRELAECGMDLWIGTEEHNMILV